MRHAEALLFVDDEQAEILEDDVLRQQAMRADDDVETARRERSSVSLISCLVRKRLTMSIFAGNAAKRSVSVFKCCAASTVVGARNATCLPSITALNAARIATSVLP